MRIFSGTVTFTDCNIYQNTGTYIGGGVYSENVDPNGQVTFTNCNIHDNQATDWRGARAGGVFITSHQPYTSTVNFNNCNI